jgi:uncharacterized protein (DUF885 family)
MGSYDRINQGDFTLPATEGDSDPLLKQPRQRDVLDFEKMMTRESETEIQTYDSSGKVEDKNSEEINYDLIEYEVVDTDGGEDLFQRSLNSIEQLQDEWVQTIGKLEYSEPSQAGADNFDAYVDNMRDMAENTRRSLFVATKYQTITSFGSVILQQLGNLMSFIKS